MLIYSFFFELDLINIDNKISSKIEEYWENKVYIVVLILVSISFILRVLAIGLLLYYRCLITTINRRKKNERDDSFINSEEANQNLSLICPDTTSIVSFSGKKYAGLSKSLIEKAKPNFISFNNEENGNKTNSVLVNEAAKSSENQEVKKNVKCEPGNLVPPEQVNGKIIKDIFE